MNGRFIRKYEYDDSFFSRIDTNEKAYWLGFIAADGCAYESKTGNSKTIRLAIQKRDEAHLEKFRIAVAHTKPLYRDRDSVVMSIHSQAMFNDLGSLGITPRKSLTLVLPNVDPLFRFDLIRGYVDGDGCFCVRTDTKTVKGTVYSYLNLSVEIVGTANVLGTIREEFSQQTNIAWHINPCNKTSEVQRLRGFFSKKNVQEVHNLRNYLYREDSVHLERKKEKLDGYIETVCNRRHSWND